MEQFTLEEIGAKPEKVQRIGEVHQLSEEEQDKINTDKIFDNIINSYKRVSAIWGIVFVLLLFFMTYILMDIKFLRLENTHFSAIGYVTNFRLEGLDINGVLSFILLLILSSPFWIIMDKYRHKIRELENGGVCNIFCDICNQKYFVRRYSIYRNETTCPKCDKKFVLNEENYAPKASILKDWKVILYTIVLVLVFIFIGNTLDFRTDYEKSLDNIGGSINSLDDYLEDKKDKMSDINQRLDELEKSESYDNSLNNTNEATSNLYSILNEINSTKID